MTRSEFNGANNAAASLRHIFGTYEAYRSSLPKREWVQLPSGGWVTQPWPWDAGEIA